MKRQSNKPTTDNGDAASQLKKQKKEKKPVQKSTEKNSEEEKAINSGDDSAHTTSTSLHVKLFDRNVSDEDIKKIFSDCGEVVHIHSLIRREKKAVHVHFKTAQQAKDALEKHQGESYGGSKLYITYSLTQPKPDENKVLSKSESVTVWGLDLHVDDKEIEKLFSDCGKIRKTNKNTLKARGFVVVHFDSESSAEKAFTKMKNGLTYKGNTLRGEFFIQRPKHQDIRSKKRGIRKIAVQNDEEAESEEAGEEDEKVVHKKKKNRNS